MFSYPWKLPQLAVFALVLCVAAVLVPPSPVVSPARAADLSTFDPGNIIDDELFYDSQAMSASEIQTFLDQKIGTCRNGQCINILTASFSSRPAIVSARTGNEVCAPVIGGTMSVAEAIYRAQVACRISAKVILVTLQKEQGLVTSRQPSDWNIRSAMGAYCPDTAPCDPAYAGIGPQIIAGTTQLQTYRAGRFSRQPGSHFIGYHPNEACGGTTVNVVNYATAGLYNYTPYQPNGAALRAGYGTGDSCSSYGNRNFFNYFTDWFGTVRGDGVYGAVKARYDAIGGRSSYLGRAVAQRVCGLTRGGCYQAFEGGLIYVNPAGYAFDIANRMREGWGPQGEWGWLGYPISGTNCGLAKGGCYQIFEGGSVFWSPATGSHSMSPAIGTKYGSLDAEWGSLGYPTSDVDCGYPRGGCGQDFEKGAIYVTPAGSSIYVAEQILPGWADRTGGSLGYPVGETTCGLANGGCYQSFEGGLVYWSPSTGAYGVTGAILSSFGLNDAEWGWMGYPTEGARCGRAQGGCAQTFERGSIYWSPAVGGQAIRPEIRQAWFPHGAESGPLGYPTSSAPRVGGTYEQTFQGGTVTVTNGVAVLTSASDPWVSAKIASPALGDPLSDVRCGLAASGCYQIFKNGSIFSSPRTGTFSVRPEVIAAWAPHGAEWGPLGYPTSNPSATGATYLQNFEGGTVTVTNGVAVLTSARDPWVAAKIASPALGGPLSDVRCGLALNGCYQVFQNGSIFSSPQTGTYSLRPEVIQVWGPTGAEWGTYGYPTSNPSSTGNTYEQTFERGRLNVVNGIARWQ